MAEADCTITAAFVGVRQAYVVIRLEGAGGPDEIIVLACGIRNYEWVHLHLAVISMRFEQARLSVRLGLLAAVRITDDLL